MEDKFWTQSERISELFAENRKLRTKNAELEKENDIFEEIIHKLTKADDESFVRIKKLEQRVAEAVKEAEKYRQTHFEHEYYTFANLEDQSAYDDAVKDMKKTCPLSWDHPAKEDGE